MWWWLWVGLAAAAAAAWTLETNRFVGRQSRPFRPGDYVRFRDGSAGSQRYRVVRVSGDYAIIEIGGVERAYSFARIERVD